MAQEQPAAQAMPGAKTALALLLAINLFNYIDRQVLAAVEPEIRNALFPNETESNKKFLSGLLASAFLVTYTLVSPVFGYLSDRRSRWYLIAVGVTIWTLASGVSGLATSFLMLFITRCFVGFGEAAYGPAAPSLISDLYPAEKRGRVLSWFYMAIPVGSALGYALGGAMSVSVPTPTLSTVGAALGGAMSDKTQWHLFGYAIPGWRMAFFVVVPPGLILALMCLKMREPPRGAIDSATQAKPPKISWREYRVLFRTRSWLFCTIGMTAMTFALGGIAWWMPAFLKEYRKYPTVTVFGSEQPSVMIFGALTALMGLVATLSGGYLGDLLRKRWSGSYFLVSGTAMLVAVPCIIWFAISPFPFAWLPLTLAIFCLFFNTGPTNTILANVTHPSIRASAFAVNIFIIHILGDVISPPILGGVIGEDRYPAAFIVVAVVVGIGGIFWLMGARYLAEDTEQAPHRAPGTEMS